MGKLSYFRKLKAIDKDFMVVYRDTRRANIIFLTCPLWLPLFIKGLAGGMWLFDYTKVKVKNYPYFN